MPGPTDANGYDYGDYPAERIKKQQRVTNERWPAIDDNGNGHAPRAIIRHLPSTVPAIARVVFDRDGEVELTGHVTRVANGCVYFEAGDMRLVRFGVWLRGEDVRRAE